MRERQYKLFCVKISRENVACILTAKQARAHIRKRRFKLQIHLTELQSNLKRMFLSDKDIIEYMDKGKIRISPAPDLETQLGSCSIDFRLSNTFRVFEHSKYPYIDLGTEIDADDLMRRVDVPNGDAFTMQPGEFVLAATQEKLELADDVMARLEGRSSLGRLGIIVHSTAGLFDPGWIGIPTLELGNLGRMPVKLYPGMRICAFTFAQLSSPARVPYQLKPANKYAGQDGPETSRFDKDVEFSEE